MTDIHKLPHDPAPFLMENLALLSKGRVLDVAMGNGRNAVFLAQNGFQVEGIDISKEAIAMALKRAEACDVEIKATMADLEDDFTMEEMQYEAIICFNYLHRPLIPVLKKTLRTGGTIVYETYLVDQARFGRPRNPAHLLKHNELLDLFREFRCLRYHEGIFDNRKALAGIIARKTRP